MDVMSSQLLVGGWGDAGSRMHIPDGFLTLPVALLLWLVTIAMLAMAVRKTRAQLGDRQIPLMGIMAAFIFAAQMLNFPVAGGTSGHFLGGALAAIVLGPWAGMLVMACVIGVQGLLFQDGGLLVMGANIFNMGLLTAALGSLYGLVAGNQNRVMRWVVVAVIAWLSVLAGALATSLELWLSGTSPLQVVVPAHDERAHVDRHWRGVGYRGGSGLHNPGTAGPDASHGGRRPRWARVDRGRPGDRLGSGRAFSAGFRLSRRAGECGRNNGVHGNGAGQSF